MSVVEKEEDGRVLPEQALVNQAPTGLGPSGFDPSRDDLPSDLDRDSYEGKPRYLPRQEKDALESFIEDIRARLRAMSNSELSTAILGCLHVSPVNCWCLTYALADVIYPFAAEEMEARRDSDGNPEGGDGTAPSHSDDSAGRQASPVSRDAALDGEG